MFAKATRIILAIAFIATLSVGVFWVVRAQDGGTPAANAPLIPPAKNADKSGEKKTPIKIGSTTFNAKPKGPDPTLIIPAEVYDRPRPLQIEKDSDIVPAGATQPAKEEKGPSLPPLPALIPGLEGSKPLVIDPDWPAPLPTPKADPEPTKVLIADPPSKIVPKKESLAPPPMNTLIPPQDTKKAPTLIQAPAPLVAPSETAGDKLKSFVRIRPNMPQPVGPKPGDDHQNQHHQKPNPLPDPLPKPPVVLPPPSSGRLVSVQTPSVTIEKRGPAQLRANETQTYHFVIRNLGPGNAQDIRIEDALSAGVKLVSADPMPSVQADKVVWTVPTLSANREMHLEITVKASANVEPAHQTSIYVGASSNQAQAGTLPVRHEANPSTDTPLLPGAKENLLTMRLTAPAQAAVGQPVACEIHVTNPSSRSISGVKLFAKLPEGLNTPLGREIEGPDEGMTFKAGESRTLKLPPVSAVKAGRWSLNVKVAAPGVEAADTANIVVTSADGLHLHQAPQTRLLPGRFGDLRIDVSNPSDKPLRNVSVSDRLPEGVDFVAATDRGLYQANTRMVHWLIDQLPPGKTQVLQLRVQGTKMGQHPNIVTAKADGAAEQTSNAMILFEGMADLNLRVVDRDKQLYLGRETVYEIQVQNKGSSADRNIQLHVQLPAGMTPKSAQGQTRHAIDKQTITFEPIATLASQGQTTFRVTAAATAVGDQRVRFAIVSDNVRTPIQREISTMVYRD